MFLFTGSVTQKNDTAVRMTHEDYADDSSETASISENEQPYSLQYNTLVAGEEDRGLEYIDCGSIVEIPANESYTAVKDDSVNISEHAYAIPKSNERSDHDYCSSEISSVAHDVSKETRPEESESVHRLKKSKLKKPGVIANDFKAAVLDHGYAYVKSVKKARSGEKQQRKPSEATDNQPADHDYIKSRPAPLRYNPLLEKISSYMKDLEQNTNATSGLSERIKTSLCMVLLTSENMMEVASKFLEIEDLDKCLRYQRMLKIEKSSRSLGNRKYGYISQLMKKSPEDLRHFNWIEIVDEFMEKFPTFFGMILSMVLVQDKMHCYTAIEKVLPRIGLVYGILMQSRNMELSRIQRMISLLLFDNIADQKVIYLLFKNQIEHAHALRKGLMNVPMRYAEG